MFCPALQYTAAMRARGMVQDRSERATGLRMFALRNAWYGVADWYGCACQRRARQRAAQSGTVLTGAADWQCGVRPSGSGRGLLGDVLRGEA